MKHLAVLLVVVASTVACSGDDDADEVAVDLSSQSAMVARAEYQERIDHVVGSSCVVGHVAGGLSLTDFLDGLDAERLDAAPAVFVDAVEAAALACGASLDDLQSYPFEP